MPCAAQPTSPGCHANTRRRAAAAIRRAAGHWRPARRSVRPHARGVSSRQCTPAATGSGHRLGAATPPRAAGWLHWFPACAGLHRCHHVEQLHAGQQQCGQGSRRRDSWLTACDWQRPTQFACKKQAAKSSWRSDVGNWFGNLQGMAELHDTCYCQDKRSSAGRLLIMHDKTTGQSVSQSTDWVSNSASKRERHLFRSNVFMRHEATACRRAAGAGPPLRPRIGRAVRIS